ncbi:MAG: haloacid dehalogenase, type [Bryobacterales bacterium]|nr:haloacid dehalogenase, type [Bryobacterales bacterium]
MVIVFDVNGTLLDTRALAPVIRSFFGRQYSVEEWFKEVVQYSMATSLAGDYRELGEIALAVLKMAAAARGIAITGPATEKVKTGMENLPPFPEVQKSLRRLRKAGFRLAALSNSSSASPGNQLRSSVSGSISSVPFRWRRCGDINQQPKRIVPSPRGLDVETREMLMVGNRALELSITHNSSAIFGSDAG